MSATVGARGPRPERRGRRALPTGTAVIAIAFAAVTLGPMAAVVLRALGGSGDGSVAQTLALPWVPTALRDTFVLIAISTALAVAVAALFAWVNERTDASLGALGDMLPILPLMCPAISITIGWTMLATSRVGLLVTLLDRIGLGGAAGHLNIYSWPGLVFLYTAEMVPFAYGVLAPALRNLDSSQEEAALVNGASRSRMLRTITLPTIRPALVNAAMISAIAGLGMYATAYVIGRGAGIDILTVRVVELLTASYPPQETAAVTLGMVVFVVVALLWIVQQRASNSGRHFALGGRAMARTPIRVGHLRWLFRALMLLYIGLAAVLPLIGLVLVSIEPYWSGQVDPTHFTFAHYLTAFSSGGAGQALMNSVRLGLVTGAVSVIVVALAVVAARRQGTRSARLLSAVTKLPAACSHMVLGLGIIILVSGPPLSLAGTDLILGLAYAVIYLPQVSIAVEAARDQIGQDLVEASLVAHASPTRTALRVILPLMLPGLVSAWAVFFLLCVGDVTVSTLLVGPTNPVIGPTVLNIYTQGDFGTLAALATTITLLSAVIVLTMFFVTRRRQRARRRARASSTPPASATIPGVTL